MNKTFYKLILCLNKRYALSVKKNLKSTVGCLQKHIKKRICCQKELSVFINTDSSAIALQGQTPYNILAFK